MFEHEFTYKKHTYGLNYSFNKSCSKLNSMFDDKNYYKYHVLIFENNNQIGSVVILVHLDELCNKNIIAEKAVIQYIEENKLQQKG